MRIGIVVNIDTVTLLPYLSKTEDKELIKNNCSTNGAPSVNTLILSFLKQGHFIRLFTIAKSSFVIKTPQLEIFAAQGYDKYPFKYIWGIFKNAQTLKYLMQNNLSDLEILHAHWTYQNAYATLPYTTQLPVFCTVRDIATYIWKIEKMKNKIIWIPKLLMNNLVFKHNEIHFIANSPYTAAIIKKKYGKEVPIIPNSIKNSFLKEDEHLLNSKQFKILCISSSNDKRKNIITLLQAFKLFYQKYPNSSLQLIGSPFINSNDNSIKKWKQKNLLKQVELIGNIPHEKLKEYLDCCSVFITPSLEETFGNTLIESIARKVPTIGGLKSGAVPFVLHHGDAGYLCDVSNPQSIFATLEYIYKNPDEALKKAQIGFKIIQSEFSEKIIYQKHIDLYKKYI